MSNFYRSDFTCSNYYDQNEMHVTEPSSLRINDPAPVAFVDNNGSQPRQQSKQPRQESGWQNPKQMHPSQPLGVWNPAAAAAAAALVSGGLNTSRRTRKSTRQLVLEEILCCCRTDPIVQVLGGVLFPCICVCVACSRSRFWCLPSPCGYISWIPLFLLRLLFFAYSLGILWFSCMCYKNNRNNNSNEHTKKRYKAKKKDTDHEKNNKKWTVLDLVAMLFVHGFALIPFFWFLHRIDQCLHRIRWCRIREENHCENDDFDFVLGGTGGCTCCSEFLEKFGNRAERDRQMDELAQKYKTGLFLTGLFVFFILRRMLFG